MVMLNTNIGGLQARYHAGLTETKGQKQTSMLASGVRIQGAGDDAAGLAVAAKMKSRIRGLSAALQNTSDSISLLQTALEGMQTSLEMVQRLRELSVQSHNGIYTDLDRQNLQHEADSLLTQLQKNADSTKFNEINLLDGTYDSVMRVGNLNEETVDVAIDGMGILTDIGGQSYASGSAQKALLEAVNAAGSSVVDFPEVSIAVSGQSRPVYKARTFATGISQAGEGLAGTSLSSSELAFARTSQASGTTSDNIPASAQANGTSVAIYPGPSIADVTVPSRFTGQGFQNGNFSADGFTQRSTANGEVIELTGWDIHLARVELDGDPYQIGGHPVPIDNDMPALATERTYVNDVPAFQQHLTLEALLQNTARGAHWDVQNGELSMLQGNNLQGFSYSVTRGPYVVSAQPEPLQAGDVISFEWFGHRGGDVFGVYGYLVNEADGSFVDLLNATGPQRIGASTLDLLNERHTWVNDYQIGPDGWISASGTVPIDGNYRFVFIAGSFDGTGGRWHGNGLSIRNIQVQQINPLGPNETRGEVSLAAIEADNVHIQASDMDSLQTILASDPGGFFTLLAQGNDFNKFTIDPASGDITALQPLMASLQDEYSLALRYDGPNGLQHIENINLSLWPHEEGTSQLSADSATEIVIEASSLSGIQNFLAYENSHSGQPVSYALAPYSDNDGNPSNNGQVNDPSHFQIDATTGRITSTHALIHAEEADYHFNINVTAADGRRYTEQVILSITEGLSASGQFSAQEANEITLALDDLTSLNDYMARHPGGTLSIPDFGLDNALFEIREGHIHSRRPLRMIPQSRYEVAAHYQSATGNFVQNITLDLTRAEQADSQISASEGQAFSYDIAELPHLHQAATQDSYAGSFQLRAYDNEDGNPDNDGDAGDAALFSIDLSGPRIISSFPLEYEAENDYHFTLVYHASDGREFSDRIIVNVQELGDASAILQAEEANQIVVNIADLTASSSFASLYPGGSYSIGEGTELFGINGSQIVANKVFRTSDQDSYRFELIYTTASEIHRENVTIELFDTLEAELRIETGEAETVYIPRSEFLQLDRFYLANPGGVFSLTGADAAKFSVRDDGTLRSNQELVHASQSEYRLTLEYRANGKLFSAPLHLSLLEADRATSQLVAEEAETITIDASILSSVQSYAARQGFAGHFELEQTGDYDKFNVAADGTLTAKQPLLIEEKQTLQLRLRFDADNHRDFIETIHLELSPGSLNQSRSHYQTKEAEKIIIAPKTQSYIRDFAAADNFAGRFELLASAHSQTDDHLKFDIDERGNLSSRMPIDFEDGQTVFELQVNYHHSNGAIYTDFLQLEILNDRRDDNNLALQGLDISTQKGALAAIEALDRAIAHITTAQAKLGAIENRFIHNLNNLSEAIRHSATAYGRIIDTDFAKASTALARQNILAQASGDMLAKANDNQRLILQLLEVM